MPRCQFFHNYEENMKPGGAVNFGLDEAKQIRRAGV
jgi:hypothetical protein